MKKIAFRFILGFSLFSISCNNTADSNIEEGIQNVSINNTEIYAYRTGISGDEEGASIIIQARHFDISEIVRNAETKWEAIYKYKPTSGFSGTDYVELELSTGSDGASPPTNVDIVKIIIHVN